MKKALALILLPFALCSCNSSKSSKKANKDVDYQQFALKAQEIEERTFNNASLTFTLALSITGYQPENSRYQSTYSFNNGRYEVVTSSLPTEASTLHDLININVKDVMENSTFTQQTVTATGYSIFETSELHYNLSVQYFINDSRLSIKETLTFSGMSDGVKVSGTMKGVIDWNRYGNIEKSEVSVRAKGSKGTDNISVSLDASVTFSYSD